MVFLFGAIRILETIEVLAKVIKAAIPEVVSIRSFRMETR